jgi:DNA-binding Xre family transcriptional regulator
MGEITTIGKQARKYGRAAKGTIHKRLSESVQVEYEQIINNIEKIRVDKKISKRKLDELSGVNSNHFGHYINFRNEPKFGAILMLCNALGMTLSEVINYHLPEVDQSDKDKIDEILNGVTKLLSLSQNKDI